MDYRLLAQSLVTNGQPSLPPVDVIRQGVIVGYDPNWNGSGHDYPVVSVQLAGETDATIPPLHGVRFLEGYSPNLGDTVWLVITGEDSWVMGSLAGSTKDTIGNLRSAIGLLGHNTFTDTTTVGTATILPSTGITTPVLPNRLYKAELTASFTVSGASPVDIVTGDLTNNSTSIANVSDTTGFKVGASIASPYLPSGTVITAIGSTTLTVSQKATSTKTGVDLTIFSDHFLSVGVITPNDYYEVYQTVVSSGTVTVSGSIMWSNTTHSGGYPSNWVSRFTDSTFKWQIAARVSSSGTTAPTVKAVSQSFLIYDLGVAS